MNLRAAIFLLWLGMLPSIPAAEIIPFGSGGWKYLPGTNEASTPLDAWRFNHFNDVSWLTGVTPIGDASDPPGGLEATIQTFVPNGTLSIFCRNSFIVADPATQTPLTLTVRHDDGFVAWLNGVEIGRFDVPPGEVLFNTAATDHEVVEAGSVIELGSVQAGVLVAGVNRLAIQVFNTSSASSDLFFDARLTAAVDDPPTVIATEPPPSVSVASLNVINITFSENVTGVDASDLLINGTALVTGVVTNNPRDYSFQFAQPSTGTVTVAWAGAHGIADIDGAPDAFVAGPSWTYTLDPNAVPSRVIISEFMADNRTTLADEDGDFSDWIELYNPADVGVDLGGWFLTDAANNLVKWRFPSTLLSPRSYLVVFASAKDRAFPGRPLHTNFKLRAIGGYLALVDSNGLTIATEFQPVYPPQNRDESYGLDRVDPNLRGTFITPTPGGPNATTGTGAAPEPIFSLESGVYTQDSLLLTMSSPPGTTIRYTLDGSSPTNGSPAYTTPISISKNTLVKARVFQNGLWPGAVKARTFVFLDSSTKDFNSNLPILILSSDGRGISAGVPAGDARYSRHSRRLRPRRRLGSRQFEG